MKFNGTKEISETRYFITLELNDFELSQLKSWVGSSMASNFSLIFNEELRKLKESR